MDLNASDICRETIVTTTPRPIGVIHRDENPEDRLSESKPILIWIVPGMVLLIMVYTGPSMNEVVLKYTVDPALYPDITIASTPRSSTYCSDTISRRVIVKARFG